MSCMVDATLSAVPQPLPAGENHAAGYLTPTPSPAKTPCNYGWGTAEGLNPAVKRWRMSFSANRGPLRRDMRYE